MSNSILTLREIERQPLCFEAIANSLEKIIQEIHLAFQTDYQKVIFTGCGTSLYLAQTAAFALARETALCTEAVPCSELYFFPEVHLSSHGNTLVIPITRKSYTTEVRMAIDRVRSFPSVKTLSITCDIDSQDYNDYMILSPDADEKSVIMTGSFTSMVLLSVILAKVVAGKEEEVRRVLPGYSRMAVATLSAQEKMAHKILQLHPDLNLFIMLGQGVYYGIANECMNKIKEMGLANSEGYYSLEYRHGPMSLVDEKTLIVVFSDEISRSWDSKLIAQMKEMGAKLLLLGARLDKDLPPVDDLLCMPGSEDSLWYAPVIGFIGQYLGYEIASLKGLNADTPRHLTQAIVL